MVIESDHEISLITLENSSNSDLCFRFKTAISINKIRL
jgi:hypothetical protein